VIAVLVPSLARTIITVITRHRTNPPRQAAVFWGRQEMTITEKETRKKTRGGWSWPYGRKEELSL
jgi:hypothetical protein